MHKLFISTKIKVSFIIALMFIASCKKEAIEFTEEDKVFADLIDMRDIFNLQKGNYWSFDYFSKNGSQGNTVLLDTCTFRIEQDNSVTAGLTYSTVSQYIGNNPVPVEDFRFAYANGFYDLLYLDRSLFRYNALYALADRIPRKLSATFRVPGNPALSYHKFNGYENVEVLGKQEKCIVWGRDSIASGSTASEHRVVEERFFFTESIGLVQITKNIYSKSRFGNPDTLFQTFVLKDFDMKFP